MTNDEQNALRALLREEVNAAVYASEQRMGERMDKRIKELENRMDKRFNQFEERMNHLEDGHRELRLNFARIDINLSEAVSVLGDATRAINELRFSQYAVESKGEDGLLGLRRDMQTLTESVHTFSRHFLTLSKATDERITKHEQMGIDETHPYPPHSAA